MRIDRQALADPAHAGIGGLAARKMPLQRLREVPISKATTTSHQELVRAGLIDVDETEFLHCEIRRGRAEASTKELCADGCKPARVRRVRL